MAGVNAFCFFALLTIISQSGCVTDLNMEDTCETLPSEIHLIKGRLHNFFMYQKTRFSLCRRVRRIRKITKDL